MLSAAAPFVRDFGFDDTSSMRASDLPAEVEFEVRIWNSEDETFGPEIDFLPTCRSGADGRWAIRANDTVRVPADLGIGSDAVMLEGMEAAIHRHPLTTFIESAIDEEYGGPTLHIVNYDIEFDGGLSLREAVLAAAETREALLSEAEEHVVAITQARLEERVRNRIRDQAKLARLIERIETAATANDKGRALEDLVAELLTEVKGLSIETRVRTTTEEIDIEIVNTSEAAFWKRSRDVVLVECKNLAGRVGKEALVSLREKVRHRRGRSDVGILVSWNGFAATVSQHEIRDSSGDVTILLIDGADLRRAVVDGMEAVLHDAFLDAIRR